MPREPVSLCLSGGGFRAMLFHLGVVRALRDQGLLTQVRHIFSVSGGSILAAHLVLNWERYTADKEDTFRECARELIDFAQRDIRGRILRRWLLLGWLRPWFNRTTQLSRHYNALYKGQLLANLSAGQRPALHIMATNMVNGEASFFDHQGIGRIAGGQVQPVQAASARVADAVAASSAFPPMFPPLTLTARQLGLMGVVGPSAYRFTDGGVFDNTGVHAARCITPTHTLLISDASAAFDQATDQAFRGLLARTIRTTDILMGRVASLEETQLASALVKGSGARAITGHIASLVEKKHVRGVIPEPELQSPALQEWVKNVRTDLDRFPDHVVREIYRHGHEVGLRMGGELKPGGAVILAEPWDPCGRTTEVQDRRAKTDRTYRESIQRVLETLYKNVRAASGTIDGESLAALKRSGKRSTGLWSARDPISWFVLLLLVAAGALATYWFFSQSRRAEASITQGWQVVDVAGAGEAALIRKLQGVGLSQVMGELTAEAHAYRKQAGSSGPVMLVAASSGPFAQPREQVTVCSNGNAPVVEMFSSAALLVELDGVPYGRNLPVVRRKAGALQITLPTAPKGSTLTVMLAAVGKPSHPDPAKLSEFLSNWRVCDERGN